MLLFCTGHYTCPRDIHGSRIISIFKGTAGLFLSPAEGSLFFPLFSTPCDPALGLCSGDNWCIEQHGLWRVLALLPSSKNNIWFLPPQGLPPRNSLFLSRLDREISPLDENWSPSFFPATPSRTLQRPWRDIKVFFMLFPKIPPLEGEYSSFRFVKAFPFASSPLVMRIYFSKRLSDIFFPPSEFQ